MAAIDKVKLLRVKHLLCTLPSSLLVLTRHYYLLYHFEVKQIEQTQ